MQAPAFDLAVVDGSLGSYNVWAGSRGSGGGGVERRGRGARGVWGVREEGGRGYPEGGPTGVLWRRGIMLYWRSQLDMGWPGSVDSEETGASTL